MDFKNKIFVFGDSILHGIQVRESDKKYVISNHIDTATIRSKYLLDIRNFSKFGCTITKGKKIVDRELGKGMNCTAVILEYGGNDCDFDWCSIAQSPEAPHLPKTPLETFCEIYRSIIDRLLSIGVTPIPTTLPPIISHKYLDWFCSKGVDKQKVLEWLGDTENITHYQENYSRAIEQIAKEKNVPLVDIRGGFLKNRRVEDYICEDGIHPNTKGQQIISETFRKFADSFFKNQPLPQAAI